MQKPLFSLLCLLTVGMAASTAQENSYYPLKVGNRWTYRATDPKSAGGKKVQIEVDRPEPYEMVRVEKNTKGEDIIDKYPGFLLKSTSDGKTTFDHILITEKKGQQWTFRVGIAGTFNTPPVPVSPPLLFLKQPLEAGNSWPVNSTLGDTTTKIKGTFTAKNENIRVPAGEFDTIAVSFRSEPENNPRVEIDYWFARGVGMVKQRVKAKNNEIILDLESYQLAK